MTRLSSSPEVDAVPNALILRKLQYTDEHAFAEAVRSFQADTPGMAFAFAYEPGTPFHDYVDRVNGWSRHAPEGFVPNTYLVAVVSGKIVGRLSLRHELNESLRRDGGHLGYAVTPAHRGRGYATEMLRQGLGLAAAMGLQRVLLTCDEDNLPSRSVIEKSGGKLEGSGVNNEGQPNLRFWIELC